MKKRRESTEASINRVITDPYLQQVNNTSISRRAFLRCAGVAGISLAGAGAIGGLVAGCGGETTSTTAAGAATTAPVTSTVTTGTAATSATTAAGVTSTSIAKELLRGDFYQGIPYLSSDWWVTQQKVLQYMNNILGQTYYWWESKGDLTIQQTNIRSMGAKGAKQLYENPYGEAEQVPVYAAAKDAGVWVGTDWSGPAWFTAADVGETWVYRSDGPLTGQCADMAIYLFEYIKGEGDVLYIPGSTGQTLDHDMLIGFQRPLPDYPGINLIVTPTDGGYLEEKTSKLFRDFVSSIDVKKLRGLIAANDGEARGMISAMKSMGMELLPVVSRNGDPPNMKAIQEGTTPQICDSCDLPQFMAAAGGVAVWDKFNGYELPVAMKHTFIQVPMVDKSNIDEFMTSVYPADGSYGMDYELMSKVLHPDDWDPQVRLTPQDCATRWSEYPEGTYKLNDYYKRPEWAAEYQTAVDTYASHNKKGPIFKWVDTSTLYS